MPTTRSPWQRSTRRRTTSIGLVGRRAVERLGGRRPPVDHQRLVVGVADPDPADVADLAVGPVQPAEHQPLVLRVQHGQPFGGLEGEDVALVQAGAVLLPDVGAAVGLEERAARPRHLLRGAGGLVEPGVDEVHVGLFDGQLRSTTGSVCASRQKTGFLLPRENGQPTIRVGEAAAADDANSFPPGSAFASGDGRSWPARRRAPAGTRPRRRPGPRPARTSPGDGGRRPGPARPAQRNPAAATPSAGSRHARRKSCTLPSPPSPAGRA